MKIKLSKSQWQFIGKKAGWIKKTVRSAIKYLEPEDNPKGPFFVSTYEVEKAYGGPEEGGWWYNAFSYVGSLDKAFNTLEEAEEAAMNLNGQYRGENDDLGSSRGFENLPEGTEDDQIPVGFSGDARARTAVVELVKGENDISKTGRPHYE